MSSEHLATYSDIDKFFQQSSLTSRKQILSAIYHNTNTPYEASNVQSDLADAFSLILSNNELEEPNEIAKQIALMFRLDLSKVKVLPSCERETYVKEKIYWQIDEQLTQKPKIKNKPFEYNQLAKINENSSSNYEWLDVKSNFKNLRQIFEEILLEKVKLFDNELTELTCCHQTKQSQIEDLLKQAQTHSTIQSRTASSIMQKTFVESNLIVSQKNNFLKKKKVYSTIEQQFCNVLIRDKSEFSLTKWTSQEEKEFKEKKSHFKSNLKINNVPVMFQFVKKHATTIKARDNIYKKWEEREINGITPEQLRYLCATSVFLNKTLNQSEKQRIKQNVKSTGKSLLSKLQFNIAEKIIQTYKDFMKKVADLRAKYYEEETEKRKIEFHQNRVYEEDVLKNSKSYHMFQKYKKMFQTIVDSQKMKLKLNHKVLRWAMLFCENLKKKIQKGKLMSNKSVVIVNKLAYNENSEKSLQYKLKLKYPSSKIIKREDQYSHRLKYRTYIPSEKFTYEKSFEQSITKINKIKIGFRQKSIIFKKQLTGGPKAPTQIIQVDLAHKKVVVPNSKCLRAVILIQAKWKAIYQRRRYLELIRLKRQEEDEYFEQKLHSLNRIYPPGKHFNLNAIKSRLQRVNMKISNILKPYVRVSRKAVNTYTSFCIAHLTNAELKKKHVRNGKIRITEFNKMIQANQYALLKKSGIVITSQQINDDSCKRNANAMWWTVYHSNVELARIFLEGGANPNSKDLEDNTCLHIAMKNGDIQIVFLLLDYGADLNRKNSKRVTPLFYATSKLLKLLGLDDGSASTFFGENMKDNNSLFYRGNSKEEDVYRQHFY